MNEPIRLKTFCAKLAIPAGSEERIRRWIEADNRRFREWMARATEAVLGVEMGESRDP